MRTLIIALALATTLHAAAQHGPRMPLKIDYPNAQTDGTPKNLDLPNTEPFVPGAKPKPLLVSRDAALVSRGKTVAFSGGLPMLGDLEQITDGDKEAPSRVELGFGKDCITIDLEKVQTLEAIAIWHAHNQFMIFFDVVVQASNDADFIEGVITLFNNDTDNSLGLGRGRDKQYVETNHGKLIAGKETEARYVRLWSRGSTHNDSNQYTEVEVYASPLK